MCRKVLKLGKEAVEQTFCVLEGNKNILSLVLWPGTRGKEKEKVGY